jgi:hypothetical protein
MFEEDGQRPTVQGSGDWWQEDLRVSQTEVFVFEENQDVQEASLMYVSAPLGLGQTLGNGGTYHVPLHFDRKKAAKAKVAAHRSRVYGRTAVALLALPDASVMGVGAAIGTLAGGPAGAATGAKYAMVATYGTVAITAVASAAYGLRATRLEAASWSA